MPKSSPESPSRLVSGVTLLAAAALTGSAAGVRWSVPARWTAEPGKPMRVATYVLPGAKGSAPGECGVFYFGEGRGGSVEENTSRWSEQFEGSPAAKTSVRMIRGLRVHVAEILGTYLSPAGPMMQSQGRKPGYRLVGAIVEGPEGLVFFKCTGPTATISAARGDFDSMLASLTRAVAAVAAYRRSEHRTVSSLLSAVGQRGPVLSRPKTEGDTKCAKSKELSAASWRRSP